MIINYSDMSKPLFSNHKAMHDIPTTAVAPLCPLSYACGCQEWRVHVATRLENRLDLVGRQYALECHFERSTVILIIFVCGEKISPICFFGCTFVVSKHKQVQGVTPKHTQTPSACILSNTCGIFPKWLGVRCLFPSTWKASLCDQTLNNSLPEDMIQQVTSPCKTNVSRMRPNERGENH